MSDPILQLFTALADAIVGEPGQVTLRTLNVRDQLILNATFPAEHHGKAIGPGGVTVDGLRLIMALAGRKRGVRVSVRLQSPEGRFDGEVVPFTPRLDWDATWLKALSKLLAESCLTKPVEMEVIERADGSSLVAWQLDATEPSTLPDEQIEAGIRAVLKVIGMANGRKIYFEMERA